MSAQADDVLAYLRIAARRYRVTASQLTAPHWAARGAQAQAIAGEFAALADAIAIVRGEQGLEISTDLVADIEAVMARAVSLDVSIGRRNVTPNAIANHRARLTVQVP